MRVFLPALVLLCLLQLSADAQQGCASYDYYTEAVKSDPRLIQQTERISRFLQNSVSNLPAYSQRSASPGKLPAVIKIPVVVHVIYNSVEQNISDAQIWSELKVMNNDYRRLNPDTLNTPLRFKGRAADSHIEFSLATIDPQGHATTGIKRKHTNTYSFGLDDGIKFSASGGDDVWDPDSYLNIWVGRLNAGLMGYSSLLGSPRSKDGIVVSYTAFGTMGTVIAPYNRGRTATHEAGHWLGLIHIWGDMYCGDDKVDDTPPQSMNTRGCPSGVVTSCNNAPDGDMYMNYMDLSNDACMNLFTAGQVARMRSSFLPNGPHYALLSSKGCSGPVIQDGNQADSTSRPAGTFVYPNPAVGFVVLRPDRNERLNGQPITILNHLGQAVLRTTAGGVHAPQIDISALAPGLYFLQLGNSKKMYKIIKQ